LLDPVTQIQIKNITSLVASVLLAQAHKLYDAKQKKENGPKARFFVFIRKFSY
jgi:hypothetical protein